MNNFTHLNQLVLTTLSKCNNLNNLKQLQSFLTVIGHSQTQFYAFKLVRFCILNLFNLSYARYIFNHLHHRNIYLFTAMVSAYSYDPGHHFSAFELYRHMVRQECPKPNHFIFPHVLKNCHNTKLVHTQIVKSGFSHYPVVQTALVDSYSRCLSDISCARQVFDEMSERNVVSWTAMINGYAKVGEVGNAIALFDKMPERDVPSWNAVIAGCTQNGLFKEAISLFRHMVLVAQTKPNQVTVVCALTACGHTGMLQLGKWIHGYMYRNYLGYDSFLSNSLVDMYGKCGSLREAQMVFDMTSTKSLTSWNSMINCFALHGHSERAIYIFEEMTKHGDAVRPDEVTFVGLLNACTHGGLVEKGRFYFDMMTRVYGIEPQIEHYGCLIDTLGRAGKFKEAMEVVREMKIEPDEVVWGSLLNGCKVYGNADLAEYVIKKLIEIDPRNGGYGIMLANLYGGLGKWDEAGKVRKMLKDDNAYKTPGCSWIEVDSEVCQFYSVDKTHPKSEEIYKMLENLMLVVI
ncbi:pentatricopeptide repeat-containing protein At1g33350 [Mercurialis annua]|uniref:pentatricopeptide repeat-containing protein At1g33350 n=1 Tax=Mercurialis annua TaxID=3986 RepID=UPI00215ECB9F|nr:pentatricopeptide repeat-containing protein At1g33350 [Mercurialis annua]